MAAAAHVCPRCPSSDYIERVPPRGVLDRVVRVFGWRVYRCSDCGTHFYDRPLARKVERYHRPGARPASEQPAERRVIGESAQG